MSCFRHALPILPANPVCPCLCCKVTYQLWWSAPEQWESQVRHGSESPHVPLLIHMDNLFVVAVVVQVGWHHSCLFRWSHWPIAVVPKLCCGATVRCSKAQEHCGMSPAVSSLGFPESRHLGSCKILCSPRWQCPGELGWRGCCKKGHFDKGKFGSHWPMWRAEEGGAAMWVKTHVAAPLSPALSSNKRNVS